jgi:N-acetylglutamate synthase-like GNAT family acetyltransferase
MIRLRGVKQEDWSAIAWLASNDVQDGDHAEFEAKWVEARQAFEGVQRQAVAEDDGAIIGYCAIERRPDETEATYRVFIVADWDQHNTPVHEALLDHVAEMLRQEGAQQAWMREFAGDFRLLQFVQERGFVISKQYEYAGKEMVNLTKELGPVRDSC